MREFSIEIHSFQDVQEFVSVATVQPFRVLVGNDRCRVNGKSFIGMFSLDDSEPLKVRADCDGEAFRQFQEAVSRFAVE